MNESMPPPNHRSAAGVPPSALSLESASPEDMDTNSTSQPTSCVKRSKSFWYDSLVQMTFIVLPEVDLRFVWFELDDWAWLADDPPSVAFEPEPEQPVTASAESATADAEPRMNERLDRTFFAIRHLPSIRGGAPRRSARNPPLSTRASGPALP